MSPSSTLGPRARLRHSVPWILTSTVLVAALAIALGTWGSTPSAQTIASANAYAAPLLNHAPVPKGATVVAHLPVPLPNGSGRPGVSGLVDVHRFFLLPRSFDLEGFVRGHLPKGASIIGTGSGSGNGTPLTDYVSTALSCPSRDVSFCQLDYTAAYVANGVQELRVDVLVVWLPLITVSMPTSGVVTLRAYGRLSLANPPRDPVSVVLDHAQAIKLRDVIASLNPAPSGRCMEDTRLYVLTASRDLGSPITWHAIGDGCGGVLIVEGQSGRSSPVGLNGNSCALRRLVASLLPRGQGAGTRTAITYCQP